MGYVFALIIVLIWSFWFVVSRLGVTGALPPIDIVFIRYITVAILLLPFVRKIPLKKIGWTRCLLISACLGTFYNLLAFYGLIYFQANHGAVIIAGFNPVFSYLYALLSKQRPPKQKFIAVLLIFLSVLLFLMKDNVQESITQPMRLLGLIFLLSAAFLYSFGIRTLDKYQLQPVEVLTANSFFSFLLIIPLYLVWGDLSLFKSAGMSLFIQAMYQGIAVSLVAVFLLGITVRMIGSFTLSFFIACIPVMTTILAFFAGEHISSIDLIAAAICTMGIIIANIKFPRPDSKDIYNKIT